MDKKSINQNQSIQDGLEKFLDDQILEYEVEKRAQQPRENTLEKKKKVNQLAEPVEEDWDEEIYEEEDYEEEDYEEEDYEEEDYEEDEDTDYEEKVGYSRRKPSTRGRSEGKSTQKKASLGKKSKKKAKKANDKKNKKQRRKEKKPKSKAKKVLTILVLVVLALGIWWFLMVGSAYKKMNHDKSGFMADGPMKEDGVINVLLIGNDSRQNGDDGRSDAMILVSISNKTKTIHMTSLLRDMYVEIPGHDSNRLNAAYSYGGASLLCETIEKNLGITVNRYAIVNFQAFAGLVDSVGGIDLEVTNEEVQWINAYLNEYNLLEGRELTTDYLDTSLSGTIHLNGPQALAYSRNRYIGTDFGRTQRQRKVLNAVVKKLPVAMATNSSKLTDELFPNLTTNLSQLECYQLSLDASKLLSYDIVQGVVPAEGTYKNATIRKMAVLEVDYEANKQMLRKEIYGEE